MSEMQDRPATLRRTPRPAPDEAVDPVDTRPAPPPAAASTPPRTRRREVTIQFSTRLAPDVIELIDAAAAAHGLTNRAVVETAVRHKWGSGA